MVILLQYSVPMNHAGEINEIFYVLRFHSAREISCNT